MWWAKEFSHEKYGANPMDQDAMDEDIKKAYEEVSRISNIPFIIPSGEAIKLARLKYGDYLTRDGYHLNERGRTLVGILWVYFLLGKTDLKIENFQPNGYTYDDVTPPVNNEEVKELIAIAKQAIKNNKGHNLYE